MCILFRSEIYELLVNLSACKQFKIADNLLPDPLCGLISMEGWYSGIILCMCSANEKRYINDVTLYRRLSLAGRTHKSDPRVLNEVNFHWY